MSLHSYKRRDIHTTKKYLYEAAFVCSLAIIVAFVVLGAVAITATCKSVYQQRVTDELLMRSVIVAAGSPEYGCFSPSANASSMVCISCDTVKPFLTQVSTTTTTTTEYDGLWGMIQWLDDELHVYVLSRYRWLDQHQFVYKYEENILAWLLYSFFLLLIIYATRIGPNYICRRLEAIREENKLGVGRSVVSVLDDVDAADHKQQ
jgi:hypothetical protein